jgi:hypothetical protein
VGAGNEVALALKLLVEYLTTQPRELEPVKVLMGA